MKDLQKRFLNVHSTLGPIGQTQLQLQSKLANAMDQGQMCYQYNYGFPQQILQSTLEQQLSQQQLIQHQLTQHQLPQLQALNENQLGGVQLHNDTSGQFPYIIIYQNLE